MVNGGSRQKSSTERRSRPTSWHPSTFVSTASQAQPAPAFAAHFDGVPTYNPYTNNGPFNTTSVNGLVTPLSVPCSDPSPVEPLQYFDVPNSIHPNQQQYASWSLDEIAASYFEPQPKASADYYQMQAQQYTQPMGTTAPPTPDFLPMQNFHEGLDDPNFYLPTKESTPAGEELVGMGLYDTPNLSSEEDVAFATMTGFGASGTMSQGSQRKSLKLEETWAPPPEKEMENEGEEEGEDDEEDTEDEDDWGSGKQGHEEMVSVEQIGRMRWI